eukprot:Pgem_evm2s10127
MLVYLKLIFVFCACHKRFSVLVAFPHDGGVYNVVVWNAQLNKTCHKPQIRKQKDGHMY